MAEFINGFAWSYFFHPLEMELWVPTKISGFWTHLGSYHKGFVYAAQLGVVVSERMQKLPSFKHIRTFIGAPFHPS